MLFLVTVLFKTRTKTLQRRFSHSSLCLQQNGILSNNIPIGAGLYWALAASLRRRERRVISQISYWQATKQQHFTRKHSHIKKKNYLFCTCRAARRCCRRNRHPRRTSTPAARTCRCRKCAVAECSQRGVVGV